MELEKFKILTKEEEEIILDIEKAIEEERQIWKSSAMSVKEKREFLKKANLNSGLAYKQFDDIPLAVQAKMVTQ